MLKKLSSEYQPDYAAKIIAYAQGGPGGYMLMRAAAREYGWHLKLRRRRADEVLRLYYPQRVAR